MKEQDTDTITKEIIAAHNIKEDEYARIINCIGRTPNLTELGVFSAMWNEHCSYKSSKKWLKTLPTSGPQVIQGPGENAGIVDIGDGQCVVFKIESHNHPSFIEPYQGAATGVGGILRDVFTMGARPIAAMNALRFGTPEHEKTKMLLRGVVSGIGGYANSFGVPTVGGELEFDACYNGNILVNAFAAGLADVDKIFYSKATKANLPVVYLGAKTGRDGVGGATMASAEFDDNIEEKRPNVQVGDPFMEKCLLEACLELMATGAVIAIQDMGAAGLTCSAVEMGAKGNLGVTLNLDNVPVREADMSAYEMLLSESQERMLLILNPNFEEQAAAIFKKWKLDFAIIGQTTDDLRFKVYHNSKLMVDLPIKKLGDEAPEYDRPFIAPEKKAFLPAEKFIPQNDLKDILLQLLRSPNLCSRRWVYEQYDTIIQSNSLIRPGEDSGVIRIPDSKKALAFSCDVTPRYCQADPFEGGKQAVAECWRNLIASGAKPLAISDNLNFGNPEKPEIMGQIVYAIKGIGEACQTLEFPVVSGNVSLYNETNGTAIFPTPTIAGVGLLKNYDKLLRLNSIQEGDFLFLIGPSGSHLGQSIYQKEIFKELEGAPPKVDLKEEKQNGLFILDLAEKAYIHACHDISAGGLAVALAEIAIKANKGLSIRLQTNIAHAELFGEDQARYIICVKKMEVEKIAPLAQKYNVTLSPLGVVKGKDLVIEKLFSIPVSELKNAYESWLPQYMS